MFRITSISINQFSVLKAVVWCICSPRCLKNTEPGCFQTDPKSPVVSTNPRGHIFQISTDNSSQQINTSTGQQPAAPHSSSTFAKCSNAERSTNQGNGVRHHTARLVYHEDLSNRNFSRLVYQLFWYCLKGFV